LALGGFSLTHGATIICVPNPRDTHFLIECSKKYGPTVIANVLTIYYGLMKIPEFNNLHSSGVKFCPRPPLPSRRRALGSWRASSGPTASSSSTG
jgi:hypothetical protein